MKIIANLIDHTSWNLSHITQHSNGEFQFSKGSVTAYGTASAKQNPVLGHKYYGRCYQKAPLGFTVEDARFEYYIGDNNGVSNLVFGMMKDTKGEWERLSSIQQLTSTPTSGNWFIRSFTVNASNVSYRKEMMIIDLTEAFGAGNEPTLEWCDEYLPYIEDQIIVGAVSEHEVGQELNFQFTGAMEQVVLYPGKYKFECWGAQGGSYSSYLGGYGGYSTGVLDLSIVAPAYVYVGGTASAATGGFNGGGNGYSTGGGGGGGSDIRLLFDSLYARIIVAGGGGGAMYANGGRGGGLNGYAGQDSTTEQTGTARNGGGASQTGGGVAWNQSTWIGKFGQAYHHPGTGYENGGGGGGWYGGAPGYDNDADNDGRGGGGGSGYVYTESSASNYPAGCLLTSDYYLSDASTVDSTRTGNGEIKITVLEIKKDGLIFIPNNNIDDQFVPSNVKVFFDSRLTDDTPTPPASIQKVLTIKKYAPFSTTYSTVTTTKTTSFKFKEWNTEIDGSGTAYHPGDILILAEDEDFILYAIWEEVYTYSGINIGTASYNGYDFLGWSPNSPTDKNNLYTGTYIYLTENTKALYPVFEQRHIRYVANGGNCPPVDS